MTRGVPVAIVAGSDGALWFSQEAAIGRITTAGQFTYHTVTVAPGPYGTYYSLTIWGVAAGPDKNIWFISSANNPTISSDNWVGVMTPSGSVRKFKLPNNPLNGTQAGSSITAGPDGALWCTSHVHAMIWRITTTGQATAFPLPQIAALDIAAGPDGALWFTTASNAIGRITTAGQVSQYPVPGASNDTIRITNGPDGALWFTTDSNQIGRITTAGQVTLYPVPGAGNVSGLDVLIAGPDGNLWFTLNDEIGTMNTAGKVSEFPLKTPGSQPNGLAFGPDGALWVADSNPSQIVRVTIAK